MQKYMSKTQEIFLTNFFLQLEKKTLITTKIEYIHMLKAVTVSVRRI